MNNKSRQAEAKKGHIDPMFVIIEIERNGKTAAVRLKSGLVKELKQFDGEKTAYRYYAEGDREALLEEISFPNGASITYDYDKRGWPTHISLDGRKTAVLDVDRQGRIVGFGWESTE